MHRLMFALVSVLTPATIVAQPAALSGDWQVTQHFFGATRYATLHVDQTGDNIKGSFAGATFECQLSVRRLRGEPAQRDESAERDDQVDGPRQRNPGGGVGRGWAVRFRRPPSAGPARGTHRAHQFTPTTFYNYFSSRFEPVLHIAPGDSVDTWSVDAGGIDASGKRRSPGGNPLTGPFYVDGAWPGDTLVVTLNRVRLTRETAVSARADTSRALWHLGITATRSSTGISSRATGRSIALPARAASPSLRNA